MKTVHEEGPVLTCHWQNSSVVLQLPSHVNSPHRCLRGKNAGPATGRWVCSCGASACQVLLDGF